MDENDLDEELLINTKLENIEKLKFDDQIWEIDPTKFIIYDKILGEGNFGKVCLAAVSLNDPIRDETQIERDFDLLNSAGGVAGGSGSHPNRLRHRFSIKRGGRGAAGGNCEFELNDSNQPLLAKGSRQAAVKMVKGKFYLF